MYLVSMKYFYDNHEEPCVICKTLLDAQEYINNEMDGKVYNGFGVYKISEISDYKSKRDIPEMKLIAAVDKYWGIGYNNDLLFHIKEDMKFFKQMTEGNIVIMGRSTLESFPGGKPLPDRINIILTSDEDYQVDKAKATDVVIVHTLIDLYDLLSHYQKEYSDKEVFVIGGASVYSQLYELCSEAYITKIHEAAPNVNKLFPNLDMDNKWECVSESLCQTTTDDGSLLYSFTKYKNISLER